MTVHADIAGYACYFPSGRVAASELRLAGTTVPAGVEAQRVPAADEDALTLALGAVDRLALHRSGREIGALAVASTTLPYGRRVQSALLVEALGSRAGVFLTEHTTSSRAGTEAMSLHAGLAATRDAATVVVASEADSAPGAGAGAVALLLAPDGDTAHIEAAAHSALERPGLDFVPTGANHRRDIEVSGYADEAYLGAAGLAVRALLDDLGAKPGDYRFLAAGGADVRRTGLLAKLLGFEAAQWRAVSTAAQTGLLGAAGPFVALTAALDAALPGDRILLVGYGAGSAADAVSLLAGPTSGQRVLERALSSSREVDAVGYLRLRTGR